MVFSKAFVVKKIEEMEGYLGETKELFGLSDEKITSNSGNMHIAERLLQLTVDTAIDVNQHLIKELGLKISDDLQGTFYILGENNVLPKEFAQKIAPVVGLRNRIVHRYDTLDKELFIKTFRKNIADFETYLRHLTQHLEKL